MSNFINCFYRLLRELKRLEDEGARLIEEELERVNKQISEELSKSKTVLIF